MKLLRTAAVLIVIAVGLWLGFSGCNTTTAKTSDTFFLNLSDTVNYVGMNECRACHEDHYNSFLRTGMGQSFGAATKERSKARFNTKPVYDPKTNMYYFVWWQGETMKITEFRLQGKDTVHHRTETISHIIGSGHHTNSHFWMDNGHVFQAPLTFYTQTSKWDLPPGYEVTNTRFSRKIDMECMSCHNAMPEVEQGSLNRFTKIPVGIDCERCHGPGELHVKEKQRGILVDTKKQADRSIVNPSRLPWKLQVDVCQRCHLQGNNVLKPGKEFTDFRPGMKLSDVFDVFMPGNNGDAFFMAGHAERLQLSACFKGSNKNNVEQFDPKLNFTCVTCHDPHVSVKETNTDKFNTSCKNCHSAAGNSTLKKCSEDPKRIAAKNNNCVSCHMPPNKTGDIPHVTVHDHFIRKNYGKITGTKNPNKLLYAVNEKKVAKQTEIRAYITWFEKFEPDQLYLKKAEELLKENESDPEIRIHFLYANSSWNAITRETKQMAQPNADAWTNYRIGKAFDKSNQLESALTWYKAASDAMSANADFAVEYANALLRSKRFKEAEVLLQKVLVRQPKHELALTNAGAACFANNKTAEAAKYLRSAITLSPDNETAHLYLAELYQQTGNAADARKHLQEALRINPNNTDAKNLLLRLGGKS
jgi:predicted Zn-dependent protease